MPKFLDAPSYYGSDGEELSLDIGFKTINITSTAQNIQFHKNLLPYGRYRINATISTTCSVYAYGGGDTVQSFTNMCMFSVNADTAGEIWFEWGEGDYGYPSENDPSFHVVFHNAYCGSSAFGAGTTLQYSPGSTVVALWGGANTSGLLGGHFYTDAKYVLNSSSPQSTTRGSSFFAPTDPGASGNVLVSQGAAGPIWTGNYTSLTANRSVTSASYSQLTLWNYSASSRPRRVETVFTPNGGSGSFYFNLFYKTTNSDAVQLNTTGLGYGVLNICFESGGFFLGIIFNGLVASGSTTTTLTYFRSVMPSATGGTCSVFVRSISGTNYGMAHVTNYY